MCDGDGVLSGSADATARNKCHSRPRFDILHFSTKSQIIGDAPHFYELRAGSTQEKQQGLQLLR